MADTKNGNLPNYERPEYCAGRFARSLCHVLMAGSEAVRAGGETYLPKWPAEKPEHYKVRAAISQLARYYQRTVEASVGMILASPPKLAEKTDQRIKDDWEDIDGKGTHGEVFTKHLLVDAVNGGYAAILVDAPPIPDGVELTHADELALGLRPHWVAITADQIISWVVDVPDWKALVTDYLAGKLTAEQVHSYAKQTIVRQIVIYEPTDVTAGEYGTKTVDRYRVLKLTDEGVTYVVYEKRQSEDGSAERYDPVGNGRMLAAGGVPFREIPLAPIYAGRPRAPFVASPPLLGLAELNLDHYQVSADRRYLLRLCHAPTLYIFGLDEALEEESGRKIPVQVGPNSVVTSTNANAKMGYAAADPQALDSSKEEKEELVRQMAVLGMSFIGKDKRGMAETATGRALDDAAENATHATVARGAQDGLEQAFRFHEMYRGITTPTEITVNTTYANPQVDPQIAAVLWNAVAADKLDVDSFITYIRTGALPDDVKDRLAVLDFIKAEQGNADAALTDAERQQRAAGKPTPMDIQYDPKTGRPTRIVPAAA